MLHRGTPEKLALQKLFSSEGHLPPSAAKSAAFIHWTEKPAGAPVAPALIVNVMDPGVELKHNTVNGANGGLILPLLSLIPRSAGSEWPAA
ncbi:MAG TPA: hypothetical protein VK555_02665 [Terriglobales bacterium]|nr:hypothetical protein [Terriglobales bacterium]